LSVGELTTAEEFTNKREFKMEDLPEDENGQRGIQHGVTFC
jgi:hypothetical protein